MDFLNLNVLILCNRFGVERAKKIQKGFIQNVLKKLCIILDLIKKKFY